MNYYYKKQVPRSFLEVVERTKQELSKEGFGILSEINVTTTLKKKLNKEFDNYIILGACNPPLALEALMAERDIGLLLPCNVVVYENEKKVFVSALIPSVAMGFVENDVLRPIAEKVNEKLKRVVDSI